jgi:hypothetical protein
MPLNILKNTKLSLVSEKLTQKPLETKKGVYALWGGGSVMFAFLLSAIMVHLHPDIAKEICELSNTAIMGFLALAVTIITGQSAFDWKAVSALQYLDEDVKVDSNANAPEVQINSKSYKSKYYENDGILS